MRNRLLGIALCVTLVSSSALASQQASELEFYPPSSRFNRVVVAISRLNGTEEEKLAKAIEKVGKLAENEKQRDLDRSMAYELRSKFRRGTSGELDDILAAISLAPENDVRLRDLVRRAAPLFMQLKRLDEGLRFAQEYGEFFNGTQDDPALYRGEIYAGQGRLDDALQEIGTENVADEQLLKRRLRYAILLTEGRYDDAVRVLEGFSSDSYYQEIVDREMAELGRLRSMEADRDTRRIAGMQFSDKIATAYTEAEPLRRVKPNNFQHCLVERNRIRGDRYFTGTIHVALQLAVAPDGSVQNVRVLDSENDCFNEASIEAAEQWAYRPAIKDGEPITRENVRTVIRYEIN